jgi:maltoporin
MRTYKNIFVFIFICLLSSQAFALSGEQLDTKAYFRTGIGRNGKGGAQSCFVNPLAADHNDFRLGNECGSYAELMLRALPLKGKEGQPYFAAEMMFAFGSPNYVAVEPANFAIRELFIEGGNLFNKDYLFWIGKRYYRDVDAHMNDFYYYAAITGNGAGISQIDTGFGKLSVALFLNSLSDAQSSPTTTNASTSAQVGTPQGRYLDFRLSNFALSEKNELNFWLGLADQSEADVTSGTLAGKRLGSFFGAVGGARYRRTFEGGTNDLALLYGYGLLSRFNIDKAVGFVAGDIIGKASAVRLVDHATYEFSKWAFHAVTIFELRNNYYAPNQSGHYFSLGLRPVLFLGKNFHLAFELGYDQGQDDGFQGGKTMRLARLTIAPEIVAAKSIWSRPALRFFYSTSFWNSGAQGLIGLPAYASNTSGTSWGFQGEIWF